MNAYKIKVEETTPGNLNLTCEVSNRPLVRSTEFGMFCDAEVCQCEQQSMLFDKDAFMSMMKANFGSFE